MPQVLGLCPGQKIFILGFLSQAKVKTNQKNLLYLRLDKVSELRQCAELVGALAASKWIVWVKISFRLLNIDTGINLHSSNRFEKKFCEFTIDLDRDN